MGTPVENLPEILMHILSYCDLRTLVSMRLVSKQFRALIDAIPTRWINVADLFNPTLEDIGSNIANTVEHSGAHLLCLTSFSKPSDENSSYLLDLPLLLSLNCPNLQSLRLPSLSCYEALGKSVMENLFRYSASLGRLEEITAKDVPGHLVVSLPALKRIKANVDHCSDHKIEGADLEILALKLSECEYIEHIQFWLIHRLFSHFCFKSTHECPEIRCYSDLINRLEPGYKYLERFYRIATRMFPGVWLRVDIGSEKDAKNASPCAGRVKEATLNFGFGNWSYEEEAPVLSQMVSLETLRFRDDHCPYGEYSTFFSFLPRLQHLEKLIFEKWQHDFTYIIDMHLRFTALKSLFISFSDFDLKKLSQVLSQCAFPLETFCIYDYNRFGTCQPATEISLSVLVPIFEASPNIRNLALSPCTADVFTFAPRYLKSLSDFYCDICNVPLALDLARERIESFMTTPELTVRFTLDVIENIDMYKSIALREAGMKLDSFSFKLLGE